jgi:hypothetical protein
MPILTHFPENMNLNPKRDHCPPTGPLAKALGCSPSCFRVAEENAEFLEICRKKGRGGWDDRGIDPTPPQQQGEEELLK